jgi:hypothetical protein
LTYASTFLKIFGLFWRFWPKIGFLGILYGKYAIKIANTLLNNINATKQ